VQEEAEAKINNIKKQVTVSSESSPKKTEDKKEVTAIVQEKTEVKPEIDAKAQNKLMEDISSVMSMAEKTKKRLDDPALKSNVYRNDETIKSNVKVSEARENDKEYEKSVFLDEKDQQLSKENFEKEKLKPKKSKAHKSPKQTIAEVSSNSTANSTAPSKSKEDKGIDFAWEKFHNGTEEKILSYHQQNKTANVTTNGTKSQE
jgi:hypothetical protein